jgi:hypothetical protein
MIPIEQWVLTFQFEDYTSCSNPSIDSLLTKPRLAMLGMNMECFPLSSTQIYLPIPYSLASSVAASHDNLHVQHLSSGLPWMPHSSTMLFTQNTGHL